jgi:hypothetical protein
VMCVVGRISAHSQHSFRRPKATRTEPGVAAPTAPSVEAGGTTRVPPLAALSEWCFQQSSTIRTTRAEPRMVARAGGVARTPCHQPRLCEVGASAAQNSGRRDHVVMCHDYPRP